MSRVHAIVIALTFGASVSTTSCGGHSDNPPGGAGEQGTGADDSGEPSDDGGGIVVTPAEGGVWVQGEDGGLVFVSDSGTATTDSSLPPPVDASVPTDSGGTDSGNASDAAELQDSSVIPDAGPPDTGPTCTAPGYHLCESDAGSVCADDTSTETCGTSCSPCPTPANGVASCGNGACSYSCDNGYVVCSTGCCSCGDTQTDPDNCGYCGHVCPGVESCTNGVCGGVVVASDQANAFAIAADEENVYWTTTGASASILQAPVGGGGATVLLTSANAYPASLASFSGGIYWSDEAGGTINRVPIGGGTNVPLASGLDEPAALVISGGQIYFALAPYEGTGSIEDVALGGGTPAALASGQTMSDPPSVAVSGSSTVYWTTSTDVMSYSGAGAQTFAANQYPYAVATDGTNVYWTSGLSNGAVMQQSTTGGSPIAIATNQYYPNTIAIDASNVYWTTGQGGAGTVMSAPIGGGGTPVTIAANQSYPFALAINSTHLFWVNFGDGSIVSAPK
ncbi:MAG: hypothetical protein ACLQVI_15080 [Polyangiaceae bacterium]|jgi:hypothetical protein